MTDCDLNHLHPDLKPLCEEFLNTCKEDGLNVSITFTYRSSSDQDALYAIGRTTPGEIVTNAKGGQSKHNFTIDNKPAAKAFDFVIKDGKGKPVWQVVNKKGIMDTRWSLAIANGEALGLRSGKNFHNKSGKLLADYGHFELKG